MARPRTPLGAYGSIAVRRRGDRVIAETRIRDADGRLRHVRVTARTAAQAQRVLRERLVNRPTFGSTKALMPQSTFADLVEVWLADLAVQQLAEGTKQNYRDQVRLHVLPAFEPYTLAEITTGRVEWFLKSQAATPRTGEANQACQDRNPTGRSATSSRCSWEQPCAPERSSRCARAISTTARPGWSQR